MNASAIARSEHLLEGVGEGVGIVLGSRRFDTVTLELAIQQINDRRVSPILFYQAVPTAVLGQIARDYRLTGPLSCMAVTGDARAEVWELARLMVTDQGAEWILALTVNMEPGPGSDSAQAYACADLLRFADRPTDGGRRDVVRWIRAVETRRRPRRLAGEQHRR